MPDDLSGLKDEVHVVLRDEGRLYCSSCQASPAVDTRPFGSVTTVPVRPRDSGTIAVQYPRANIVVQNVRGPVKSTPKKEDRPGIVALKAGVIEDVKDVSGTKRLIYRVLPHHAEIAAEVNAAAPLLPLSPRDVARLDVHAPGLVRMPDPQEILDAFSSV